MILRDHSVKLGSRPVLFAETKGINWQHYILIAASWIAVGVFLYEVNLKELLVVVENKASKESHDQYKRLNYCFVEGRFLSLLSNRSNLDFFHVNEKNSYSSL